MKPEDMAFTVLNGLLEDGWCTKDDVIRAFNKHKISMIHLNQAIERTGATLTTRGFADHVQTYYLKGKGEQGTEANHKYCNQ